jgi:chlorobactene glucosyltransferase
MLLTLSIAWAVIVAALIGRAVRQYGAYQQLTAAEPPLERFPNLVVVAPARNEGRNVGQFLERLLAQNYPTAHVRFILIDDHSTDDTAAIAEKFAAADLRLHVMSAEALPDGWKGKPHACWHAAQSVEAASDASADAWFCFIDVDTKPDPALLQCAMARAQRDGVDLLSLEPFQILGSFWERVIFPAGFLLLAFSQDLRRVNNPSLPDAFANGQFILIRRRVYDAVGGHEATRSWFAEDTALARAVKSAGFRIAVLGAEQLISTRMYHNLAELWEGLAKVLIEMIGGRTKTIFFAAVGVLLAVASLGLPPWAWMAVHSTPSAATWLAAILATAASAAMFGVHIGCAVYLKIPFWYGLLFPLGCLAGAPLTVYSFWTRANGRIAWKGRVYASAREPSAVAKS